MARSLALQPNLELFRFRVAGLVRIVVAGRAECLEVTERYRWRGDVGGIVTAVFVLGLVLVLVLVVLVWRFARGDHLHGEVGIWLWKSM